MKLILHWDIQDGYVGGSRPQKTKFDTSDYEDTDEDWNNLSENEKQEYFNAAIQEDFEQKVSFYLTSVEEKE